MPFDCDAPAEVTTRDRLIRLRDFLAGLQAEKFYMNVWTGHRHDCGTVACIAGWAEHLFGIDNPCESAGVVGGVLGLDWDASYELFYPPGEWGDNWEGIGTAQAVKVLDHLIATGEVDWLVAAPTSTNEYPTLANAERRKVVA